MSLACVFHAVSRQILADHGKEAPGERRMKNFLSAFVVHTFWIEALYWRLSSMYQAFPVFYFLYHCMEIGIFFFSIFAKKAAKVIAVKTYRYNP